MVKTDAEPYKHIIHVLYAEAEAGGLFIMCVVRIYSDGRRACN